ncbi:hypothetical protein FD723_40540 (plasmid) [Nostoc sp. C052]|uniref:hypothetical protein n=1 Tax=Nostoc sp. C052 TaxID=2576902 RepID=UPI0015C300BE|nr:hypothetical protein [Nostoc sp. C052]QLE46503.1 hypothetical protein FD723_40540 [Nostoc sp. C052]
MEEIIEQLNSIDSAIANALEELLQVSHLELAKLYAEHNCKTLEEAADFLQECKDLINQRKAVCQQYIEAVRKLDNSKAP